MQLVLNEDQTMLAKTAADFVERTDPIARLRKLRDAKDALGWSPDVWKQMAELGWLAIPFDESEGGAGLGLADLAIVAEALGRGLAPEPFVPAVALGGRLLARGGSDATKGEWLERVLDGSAVVALAYQEVGSRFDPLRVTTSADESGDGWRLRGEKVHVLAGGGADALVVSARTAGESGDRDGLSLFLVPADAFGVSVTRQWRVDSLNAAQVVLDGVDVPKTALLGGVGLGADLLDDALDAATATLCAEMVGSMSEAFERTLAYMKERVQFGVAIGSFQALKHRAARVFVEVELARSAVMAATRALDAGSEEGPVLVSVAKARCSDAFVHAANEAVQIHGGIGMTDEHDIGFFLKRARGAEMSFGDAAWHRDRFARLSGF